MANYLGLLLVTLVNILSIFGETTPEATDITYICPDNLWVDVVPSSSYCYYLGGNGYPELAKRVCDSIGGSVLSHIRNPEELASLVDFANDFKRRPNTPGLLVNMTQNNATGEHVWGDQTPVLFEPQFDENEQFDEDCRRINLNTGKFESVLCFFSQEIMCKIEKVSPIPKYVCPTDQWVDVLESSRFCYYYLEYESFPDYEFGSVNTGTKTCRDRLIGGEIVSHIDSEEELSAILEYVGMSEISYNSFVIGARQNSNGDYVWFDHTPVSFTKWGEDEPSDKPCIKVENGYYKTTSCREEDLLICQIEKVIEQ